jgi:oligopeptide transport system substrate-binding protein
MWQENLGITLRKCQGKSDNMDLENRDDFNVFFIGWLADYPDPASFLESNYLIDFCHWKSAVYEALIEQGHHLLDQSLRLAQYRQADRVLMQEAVVLPLFYGHIYEIRQPWVQRLSGSSIYNPQWKDTILNFH